MIVFNVDLHTMEDTENSAHNTKFDSTEHTMQAIQLTASKGFRLLSTDGNKYTFIPVTRLMKDLMSLM